MMVAFAVMILRRTAPHVKRDFKTPMLWLIGPATIVGCIFLFFNLPLDAMLVLPGWGIIGVIIYVSYGMHRSHLAKDIVEVVPPAENEPLTPGV